MIKSSILLGSLLSPFLMASPALAADAPPLTIVQDGKPRAEIVVTPEDRPRMTSLAALELQHFLEKMSGARLPIVTEPTTTAPIKIFVGESPWTEKLGITTKGLKDGAFRIATGSDWLVLLGEDADFDLTQYPVPIKRSDKSALERWEQDTAGATDAAWGFPFGSKFKMNWSPNNFNDIISEYYGSDAVHLIHPDPDERGGFWMDDKAGSLNAVSAFLTRLGVRFYMPGELGEIVPESATITIPATDETVKPDYALRNWMYYNYSSFPFHDVIWGLRLGMNSGDEEIGPLTGPHGLGAVHSADAMKKAHPEYYAIINGKPATEHRGSGTPNLLSDGLVAETVKYIRFLFDKYDLPSVDIWPVDGLQMSQEPASQGKTHSDVVWGFADRVAREVYKTHPNKRITGGAYASYTEAPDTIEKFSPNLAVWIANAGRPMMDDPAHWAKYQARVDKWRSKIAPGNILRLENNRYSIWGRAEKVSFPIIHPHAIAKDLKYLNGVSLGDRGEQSQVKGTWQAPGLDHITLYVQSRFLWDADQNIEPLLDEYFTTFYGPAAAEMKEAITYAEQNYSRKDQSRSRGRGNPMNVTLATHLRFRELLAKARQVAGDTVYGQRIEKLISELEPEDVLIAEHKKEDTAMAETREKAPLALAVEGSDLTQATIYTLQSNQRGDTPITETTFRVGWDNDTLVLDILCKEPDIANLNVSEDVESGDYVAISIDTPEHSYYHIEVNPDGQVKEGNPGPNWKSLAEVKTERGPDFWRVQLRFRAVGPDEAASDPHHRIAGSKPTSEDPWFFNVGRRRAVTGQPEELQAFSPSKAGWHTPEKFGRLEVK